MTGMRITCVLGPFLPAPPVLGGAVERFFLSLCTEFAARGHGVTLISRRYADFAHDETVDGVRHLRVPSFDAPASKPLYRALDLLYAARVCSVLPRSDVTITNSVSLPLIIPRDRAGAVCVNVGRYPKGQMGLYRRAARLHAVSSAVANAIAQQAPDMAPRVRTIGIPLSQEFVDVIAPRQPRRKTITYVGRIAREKGLHLLVPAFAKIADQFPEWRLEIIGPSEARTGGDGAAYLNALREQAAPLQQRVVFGGPIFDPPALIARLRDSEVFVYPSIAERGESFGLAPLEAMACGCAVIVSGLECFTDFLRDGVNGIRFDHRTDAISNLADACARLMHDRDQRDRLAAAGLETARRYTPAAIADLMVHDFAELKAERSLARPSARQQGVRRLEA